MELVLAVIVVLIAIAAWLYGSAYYHASYWRRRGIPGPPSSPIAGNSSSWWGGNIVLCLHEWTKTYGKVYGVQEGHANILVLSDMDMLQEVFVKKFDQFHGRKVSPILGNVDVEPFITVFNSRGARWKRLRAIVNPAFSVANLKRILPIVNDSAAETMRWLDKAHAADKPFNIHRHFQEFTMDVISRIAMGQQESNQWSNEYSDIVREFFGTIATNRLFFYSFWWPSLVPLMRKFAGACSGWRKTPFLRLQKKVKTEVANRKKTREALIAAGEPLPPGHDFIDFFFEVESEEAFTHTKPGEGGLQAFDRAGSRVSREMTIDEISAMCFVFVLAGFDTTANTLATTCYCLAKNPQEQEMAYDEICNICGDEPQSDDGPSYEQLAQLTYVEACMKEALRLYPIAALGATRLCMESTTVGSTPIEAGTYVQADVFSCHYDPEVWGEDVATFRPDRMIGEYHPHMAWFPFGAGPRTCVGMKLAYLEERALLVHLLKKYRLVMCDETEPELELVGGSVLAPKSVTVKLELRT